VKFFSEKHLRRILLVYPLLFAGPLWGLQPLDSLIFGEFEETKTHDPLAYVFRPDSKTRKVQKLDSQMLHLRKYVGFYWEGENLKNRCSKYDEIEYPTISSEQNALRSVGATLQYIGLDVTTRAIVEYTKRMNLSRKKVDILSHNLVNYCSKNLSVISKQHLKKYFLEKYDSKVEFPLPTYAGNKYFPILLSKFSEDTKSIERELYVTVDLFKAFCSWGGDVKDFRVLPPLLRNPQIMAFVNRNLEGAKIFIDDQTGRILTKADIDTTKVSCIGFLCRKTTPNQFIDDFPKSMGFIDLKTELDRLYCKRFRDVTYPRDIVEPTIGEWIDNRTVDYEIIMSSQFVSLLTGFPDFFIRSGNYQKSLKYFTSSFDESFNRWAFKGIKNFSTEVNFEESITLDKIKKKREFLSTITISELFAVEYDVNLGEWDKSVDGTGKIKLSMDIMLRKNFVNWVISEWNKSDPRDKRKRKNITKALRAHIAPQLEKNKSKFIVPPWQGDLAQLIANDLVSQMSAYSGDYFFTVDNSSLKIPVIFRYGVFALKYINYRFKSERGFPEIEI
jgi:hypothetical protein